MRNLIKKPVLDPDLDTRPLDKGGSKEGGGGGLS